jgi:hypothetical protein
MRYPLATVLLLPPLTTWAQFKAFGRADSFILAKPAGLYATLSDTIKPTPTLQLQPGDVVTLVGSASDRWYVLDQPIGSQTTFYYVLRDSLIGANRIRKGPKQRVNLTLLKP